MKKLLPLLGFTFLMAACNTMPEKNTEAVQSAQQTLSQPDTTGMAAFNVWKAQNELASVNAYQQPQQAQTQSTPEKTRTIVKYVPVKQSTSSKPVAKTSSSSNTASSPEPKSESSVGSDSGSTDNGSGETAQVEKKEGWSKAAKGAVIGGVAGAAGGAILNKKNRVAGAVIGGVIGAAGGYGVGRTMDKKDGRIDYSTIIN